MSNWDLVINQAAKAFQTKTEWTSFIKKRRYEIKEVHENEFIIKKLSGGKDVPLTRKIIEAAIEKLKQAKRLKKTKLLPSVSRETALIYLHPYIHWDSAAKETYWDPNENDSTETISQVIDNASDDDIEYIKRLIRKRKNQSKFRKSLIKAYEGKCCISNCNTLTVLEAAHIINHSITGINHSSNGLLLRSDLHILFDENLLLIHPKKMTIHLHPDLLQSEYSRYNGNVINSRIDNTLPNFKYLKQKWDSANLI